MEVDDVDVTRFADRFAALGHEPRLKIVRLLLSAHPDGMIVGDIQQELGMAASTLSHHLEKLKNEELVTVRRDRQFLWYAANIDVLKDLLAFLWAECCTRNQIVTIKEIQQWKPANRQK
jgi:DNA-binding transcriptional ArsR family regulator